MGTTATLERYESEDGKTSWRLFEELFGSGAVYLELNGVGIELEITEKAPSHVVLRLPLEMARRLTAAKVEDAKWEEIAKRRTLGIGRNRITRGGGDDKSADLVGDAS